MSMPMPKTKESLGRYNNLQRGNMDTINDGSWELFKLPMLLKDGKRKCFSAREVLYHEGDRNGRIYLIRSGLVKLLRYLPNGRARIVRLHTEKDWLGLEGLLGIPCNHTAIAFGHVEVEHFSIHNLVRLHWENPEAFSQLLCQWYGHLVKADKWISDFSTGEIKSRVARLLAYLADLDCNQPAGTFELLTVHEMADILGVTPESVSRHLASFKRQSVLQRQVNPAREIYQIDNQRLQQEMWN
jgi:CRP/FNR family transcriptional regulator, anaerobic regulatory protein